MDNQHRMIEGYRELNVVEIGLMNEIKAEGVRLEELIHKVRDYTARRESSLLLDEGDNSLTQAEQQEADSLSEGEPYRWAMIARTHLQQGIMALTRAVAKPRFF